MKLTEQQIFEINHPKSLSFVGWVINTRINDKAKSPTIYLKKNYLQSSLYFIHKYR